MGLHSILQPYVDYVMEYVGCETNDWLLIRKEIIGVMPPRHRSFFERRHFSTKKTILNEYDYQVINYWEKKTGQKLVIDESKLHPSDWVQKPHGHGLQKYNEERRKNT